MSDTPEKMSEDLVALLHKLAINKVEQLGEQMGVGDFFKKEQTAEWKAANRITMLEARIKFALRLNRHGMVGFISSALRGEPLDEVTMFKDCNLLQFLDACDREDEEYEKAHK